MSQSYFNRVARLTIGKPSGATVSGGIIIESPLRITFDITKTEHQEPNQATIAVNNLSEKTRGVIKSGAGMVGILEAGYVDAGGALQIFYGDVFEVNHDVTNPEIITTIVLMDGLKAVRERRVSVSYKKGTPVSRIIKEAANSLGLSINATFDYVHLPETKLDGTTSFAGSAAEWLNKLCSDNGLVWSVQNGSLKITEKGKSDNLSAQKACIIGSPKRLFRDENSESQDNFSGYEFDCTLLPKCEPGNTVSIQSRDITKPTKLLVAEVKHKGDNYGEEWKSTIKGRDL